MSVYVALKHKTEYHFSRPVNLGAHTIRLRPAPHVRTPVHQYSLQVHPAKHFINWQQDPFGNYLARLVFPEKTNRLTVEVGLVAELVSINPFDFFLEDSAKTFPFKYKPQLKKELQPYFDVSEKSKRLTQWLRSVPRHPEATVDFLVAINARLQKDVSYNIRMEPGIQSCEETLKKRTGSCRDSAWLLVQIMRRLGLAARFVSGYLVQLTADQKSLDGPSGPESDFTDLHAWAEVYVPGAGWVGLDPTSGLFAGEGHIPLACTPDPASAAPIEGATDKCEVEFKFVNEVTRIREDPRVTKPYSEKQWTQIMQLGDQIDVTLQQNDVRLTTGGEPTFVSIDDMDSAQWNTAALGEHKRERAEILLRSLWQKFAPGGVLHHGQGKWYPGEPLPRWALSCYWRDDAKPVWHTPALLADPLGKAGTNSAHQAQSFIQLLAEHMQIPTRHAQAGYEDGFYYLWKEGTLPKNVDVLDSKLADKRERERIRQVFEQGLDNIVGYALPVAWDGQKQQWVSSQWEFRRTHMFLVPGDSPMGFRLPLDALLWEKPDKQHRIIQEDLFAEQNQLKPPALFEPGTSKLSAEASRLTQQTTADAEHSESDFFVRTAICVEPRNGHLHIFLPPMEQLQHWLDMLQLVEATAKELNLPIVLEGYPAPLDTRLKRFSVTPDPGVIEVNIHPSSDWQTLVNNTQILYQEAREARLGTEKFMLDGRHTGTGGGNHITLGGITPGDSPMLRKPQVLASLVRYWQNHPALSYLFSGMFIGPTSQAPRVDEGRDDSLYELEIALQQINSSQADSPWVVDRVLRNLLVDLTGNTHRAEFCIDKLYSPDSALGRLGIVEFRGFEMPPHAQMALVQNLLLRALVARFWEQPYTQKTVPWHTELHDRFMLPHYVERDAMDVIQDLKRWGYAFDPQWLAPFVEFRFPRYGTMNINDIELELRFAIEPWHVLGEEAAAQGTARYVDSSVERLQLMVNGITASRHIVTCNGRRIPLRNTGKRGEYVAGVRYKAWNPASALHPTIGVHAPLTFDVIDSWSEHSLGGCTYHVQHPGGRNTEDFPVNANAAEARRLARFWQHGHTNGKVDIPPETPAESHPYTLDLRHTPDM
jgi:uncharacterized protein (DUF2126 family)/transglutaminase-like putative cysteine protease